ncbi:MAG: carbon monoxide dehydrogenase [Acidobacteria bacterium]|nr:MAG: carbon monoxide dehydrogenase [Acidobacteriota bacterium]PYY23699.1 MAG: carbon monoxide dehydrogenase [Acidobacteriota bacterium]
MTERLIGSSLPRTEGRSKVTGQARYVDDLSFPEMLHGVTVRSSIARGSIRNIQFDPRIPWHEFTIVTSLDIPGRNRIALIADDQPCLSEKIINHAEEPVLLLAHSDEQLLEEARRFVTLDIDPLPAIFDIDDALAKKEIIWGSDNVFKTLLVEKGDVDSAWAKAHVIVEGEYHTGAQEQLYIEPQGMIAQYSPESGITIWGSMQCPYYVHKALILLLNLPSEKVRVIQTETGGAFGGKEEYPSVIACHAALLARKAGRPVKIIYDRAEDMAATTKRHPSRTRHRTAVSRDGKLLAMDIEFTVDGGAYSTLSTVVLSRGTIHAGGPYVCPNVRIRSKAVATNHPPHGAFRGFGAPQSIFALERHMDRVAKRLNMSPAEFRRRNFVHEGESLAVSQIVREPINLEQLMNRALELSEYRLKQERFARENQTSKIKRGMGFASFMHGAGFTGSGERSMGSVLAVEVTKEGRIRVLASSTEMGQGTNTVFRQIAAEALGVEIDAVEVATPDTSMVPNSGPTVASRTCMIVGKLVESACLQIREVLVHSELLRREYSAEEFKMACGQYIQRHGMLKAESKYSTPAGIFWDDEKYQGDAYATYAWAVYVAEVSVDSRTWETQVEDFVAVQEVGRVVNPILAHGQIEGGVAQGIGYALYEDVCWREGRMVNAQMTNYIMPTSADLPPIRVYFEEVPYKHGPGGAKGIGELPIDGPAPAIVNAIENAIGVPIDRIPATPEVLMRATEAALV